MFGHLMPAIHACELFSCAVKRGMLQQIRQVGKALFEEPLMATSLDIL